MRIVKAINDSRDEAAKKIIEKSKTKKGLDAVEAPRVPEGDITLEESLVNLIDEASTSSREPVYWKHSVNFPPSATNKCPRYLAYRLEGYEHVDSFSSQLLRIFDNGNDFNDRLGKYFADMGVLVELERPVNIESPPVAGFVDMVINFGQEYPIEAKTINEAGFAWRRAYHKPKDDHIHQIQMYLRAGDWETGFVIYENKNTQELLVLKIDRDDEYIDNILAKYAIIYNTYESGEIPIRPYKKASKNCSKCSAFNYCWNKDTREGVKLPK